MTLYTIRSADGLIVLYTGHFEAAPLPPLEWKGGGLMHQNVVTMPDDSPADEAGKRNARHNETLSDIKARTIARPILDAIVKEGQAAQRDNAAGDAIKRRQWSR